MYTKKKDVSSLQPRIPPKRFDIFPPVWDAQQVQMRSDFSLKTKHGYGGMTNNEAAVDFVFEKQRG